MSAIFVKRALINDWVLLIKVLAMVKNVETLTTSLGWYPAIRVIEKSLCFFVWLSVKCVGLLVNKLHLDLRLLLAFKAKVPRINHF